jgi:energy-coupling factor transporter ATP-binding protein EcfA2
MHFQCIVVQLDLVRSSFFERVCGCFGAEVRDRSELRDLLNLQLLMQIDEKMLTIDRFTDVLQSNVAQPLQEINTKLDKITNYFCPPGQTEFIQSELPANPFMPLSGWVDDPQHFFDQEKLIKDVFEFLNAGSSVALIGERGIGKSSVLKEIERISQQRLNRQAVYVDLNLVRDEEDFWGIVCHGIRVQPRNNSERIKAVQSRRILLLLDEVEQMERQIFGEEIRTQLRGFAQGGQMKVIVAACVSLDVLFPGEEHSLISLFNNLCTEYLMKSWSDEVVRLYIKERLQDMPVRFTETEIRRIIQSSQGIPQKLVKNCYQLYKDYRDHYETR